MTAGLPTVGLRMPAHPLALELIRAAGVPIAAPSANRFTELSPTAAGHVPEALADGVLDGGPARVGIESTVLSLVGRADAAASGRDSAAGDRGADRAGAGRGGAGRGRAPLAGHARAALPSGDAAVLLGPGEPPPAGRGAWLRIGREMPADPLAYAAALYATLHRLDAKAGTGSRWSGRRIRRSGRECWTGCSGRRNDSISAVPEHTNGLLTNARVSRRYC